MKFALSQETATTAGLLVLWNEDVAPSKRTTYQVKLGNELVAEGDAKICNVYFNLKRILSK